MEGTPEALVREHAGGEVIEVEVPSRALRDYVLANAVDHDDLGERIIMYATEESGVGEFIRREHCGQGCRLRAAGLEDVFLRLTGRELRE